MEIARSIHPALYQHLRNVSNECDRLGIDGANLYRCDGYIAPLHLDNDAAPGLCAQLEWEAKEEWSEFGFCQPQYGYYIHTEANMIWYEDSFEI